MESRRGNSNVERVFDTTCVSELWLDRATDDIDGCERYYFKRPMIYFYNFFLPGLLYLTGPFALGYFVRP
jgi:hypothetical protein